MCYNLFIKIKEVHMKRRILKYAALFAVISLLTAACLSVPANAEEYNYVKDGLEALYIGNNNTGNGQDKNATVWKDLSGKNRDITDVPKNGTNYFTDTGYHLDTMKVYFPASINDIVNGQEFTIEVVFGDIEPKGSDFLTFVNCANDNFSLFRRNAGDKIEVKTNNSPGERPEATGGLEYFKNSTVTVTYKVGGKCIIYVDGEKIDEKPVSTIVNVNTDNRMWFGHDEATRNHATEYRAIRFYSKELTADQVKANYEVDKAVLGKAYTGGGTTSTPAESSAASSQAAIESSAAASSAATDVSSKSSASAAASSAAASEAAEDDNEGGSSYYIYIIIAAVVVLAAVVVFVIINNKKDKEE